MADTPNPTGGEPTTPPRRYWIDDDGNVHGVVMTVEVDQAFEFTVKAINHSGESPPKADQPAA